MGLSLKGVLRVATWPARKVAGAVTGAAQAAERKVMGYLIKTFLLKALYALAGILATALLAAASVVPPPGTDQTTMIVWGLVVSALTGLAAVLKKAATGGFSPEK